MNSAQCVAPAPLSSDERKWLSPAVSFRHSAIIVGSVLLDKIVKRLDWLEAELPKERRNATLVANQRDDAQRALYTFKDIAGTNDLRICRELAEVKQKLAAAENLRNLEATRNNLLAQDNAQLRQELQQLKTDLSGGPGSVAWHGYTGDQLLGLQARAEQAEAHNATLLARLETAERKLRNFTSSRPAWLGWYGDGRVAMDSPGHGLTIAHTQAEWVELHNSAPLLKGRAEQAEAALRCAENVNNSCPGWLGWVTKGSVTIDRLDDLSWVTLSREEWLARADQWSDYRDRAVKAERSLQDAQKELAVLRINPPPKPMLPSDITAVTPGYPASDTVHPELRNKRVIFEGSRVMGPWLGRDHLVSVDNKRERVAISDDTSPTRQTVSLTRHEWVQCYMNNSKLKAKLDDVGEAVKKHFYS